jgi:hypothetical protein
MSANGSFDFASGGDGTGAGPRAKKPKEIPLAFHGSSDSLPECIHPQCASKGSVRHGEVCDGSIPRWEAVLVLELLTPSLLLRPVADSCRTLVIASGSLAPLPSLCAELGLHPASEEAYKSKSPLSVVAMPVSQTPQSDKPEPQKVPSEQTQTENDMVNELSSPLSPKPEKNLLEEKAGRLQMKPGPLEADHVINLEKQLRAISIGSFPDGSPLSVTFANYKMPGRSAQSHATFISHFPLTLSSSQFIRVLRKAWSCSRNDSRSSPERWSAGVHAKLRVSSELPQILEV